MLSLDKGTDDVEDGEDQGAEGDDNEPKSKGEHCLLENDALIAFELVLPVFLDDLLTVLLLLEKHVLFVLVLA